MPVTCSQVFQRASARHNGPRLTRRVTAAAKEQQSSVEVPHVGPCERRTALASLLLTPLAAAFSLRPGAAQAAGLEAFEDGPDAFDIQVPAGWQFRNPQEPYDRFRSGVSSRRTLVWFPDAGTDVNVSVVVTTPGADYTSLKSFGTADDFGNNLVQSMDRSYLLRKGSKPAEPVVVCKLAAARNTGDAYYVEYTIQKGDEPAKRLYSLVTLGFNGHSRRFYTVTAACPEARRGDVEAALKESVLSLRVRGQTA